MKNFFGCFFVLVAISIQGQNTLKNNHAMQFLPQETWVAVSVNNIVHLTDRLGRKELISKYQQGYDDIVAKAKKEFGFNVFSEIDLKNIGLDLTMPCGLAVIDAEKSFISFFAHISDAKKLKNTIAEFAEKKEFPLQMKTVGDALVIHNSEKNVGQALVIRGKTLFLVIADRYRYHHKILEYANAIATLAKEKSLAANKY